MRQIRRSQERGHANHGWLDSYHSFSFASYYDPQHMGFRVLRVINEDRIEGGQGFGTHPHRDMEIITYMLEGALEHRDSMGNGSVIRPGEIQVMSAGEGVTHSEFNASQTQTAHLLQIWILPAKAGGEPGYQQKFFDPTGQEGKLTLLVSPDGAEGSLTIKQDARIYRGLLNSGQSLVSSFSPKRSAWLQIAKGTLQVDDITLQQGDALALREEDQLTLHAETPTEFLLFDLP